MVGNRFSYLGFIALALIFTATSLHALIVKLSDLHTMAKRSDVVVHGYVGEQNVATDDLGRFVTLTEIEVIDGLYGAKTGEIITVYQVGGQKNGVVMPVVGGQQYNVGQEVILFGLKLGSAFVSYGAGQGKLDVINENGNELVVEDLGDVASVSGPKNREVFKPMPLNFQSKTVLIDEIRQMINTR